MNAIKKNSLTLKFYMPFYTQKQQIGHFQFQICTFIITQIHKMNNRQQQMRATIKRQKQVSSKEKYLEAYQKYLNGQFTYDTHCLLQNLTEKGKREPHMQGVQLYKTLIEIAKILMLNQLQILFLGATLEEMKWKIIDNCLNNYIQQFRGLVQNLKSDSYNKKIQLSLLLIGFVVKLYLNQGEQTTMCQSRLREIVGKDYDKMYQQWVQKMKKNFKFSPKNVNKLFKQMDVIKSKKQSQLDEVNYNSKVQQLFKRYVDPQQKNQHIKRDMEQEESPIQYQQQIPQNFPTNPIIRTQSIQSLRSLSRRQSQRSEKQFGGFGYRNYPSIFRNNSINSLDEQ